ncbi:hypothetical protein QJS10_CPB13g01253 [Acorus calamus]|uniref:Uncharacterized protein n=1 Tax=Acorus calamus TaxID=4465 RepID=A0AAV9DIW4_ACOCL|nr:hypothetical protein QJS10_CPB13g01253 [Acorus calamus]
MSSEHVPIQIVKKGRCKPAFQPTRKAKNINMSRTKRTKMMWRTMRPMRMCSIGRLK